MAAENSSSVSTPWACRSASCCSLAVRSSPAGAGAGAAYCSGAAHIGAAAGLRIGGTLLVGLVVLLLGSRILLGILLILVVTNRTSRTGDHRRADCHTGNTSSNHSSSHHVDLFSFSIQPLPAVRPLQIFLPEPVWLLRWRSFPSSQPRPHAGCGRASPSGRWHSRPPSRS